jgi:hypothetical protein
MIEILERVDLFSMPSPRHEMAMTHDIAEMIAPSPDSQIVLNNQATPIHRFLNKRAIA